VVWLPVQQQQPMTGGSLQGCVSGNGLDRFFFARDWNHVVLLVVVDGNAQLVRSSSSIGRGKKNNDNTLGGKREKNDDLISRPQLPWILGEKRGWVKKKASQSQGT